MESSKSVNRYICLLTKKLKVRRWNIWYFQWPSCFELNCHFLYICHHVSCDSNAAVLFSNSRLVFQYFKNIRSSNICCEKSNEMNSYNNKTILLKIYFKIHRAIIRLQYLNALKGRLGAKIVLLNYQSFSLTYTPKCCDSV